MCRFTMSLGVRFFRFIAVSLHYGSSCPFSARSQNCEMQLLGSLCPSVCTRGTSRLPLDGFSWILIFEHFSKICRENSSFLMKLYVKTSILFWSYLAHFLEWKMFQTKVAGKLETRILCSVTFFFRKSCCLWDNVENYCRAGRALSDNMHAG